MLLIKWDCHHLKYGELVIWLIVETCKINDVIEIQNVLYIVWNTSLVPDLTDIRKLQFAVIIIHVCSIDFWQY